MSDAMDSKLNSGKTWSQVSATGQNSGPGLGSGPGSLPNSQPQTLRSCSPTSAQLASDRVRLACLSMTSTQMQPAPVPPASGFDPALIPLPCFPTSSQSGRAGIVSSSASTRNRYSSESSNESTEPAEISGPPFSHDPFQAPPSGAPNYAGHVDPSDSRTSPPGLIAQPCAQTADLDHGQTGWFPDAECPLPGVAQGPHSPRAQRAPTQMHQTGSHPDLYMPAQRSSPPGTAAGVSVGAAAVGAPRRTFGGGGGAGGSGHLCVRTQSVPMSAHSGEYATDKMQSDIEEHSSSQQSLQGAPPGSTSASIYSFEYAQRTPDAQVGYGGTGGKQGAAGVGGGMGGQLTSPPRVISHRSESHQSGGDSSTSSASEDDGEECARVGETNRTSLGLSCSEMGDIEMAGVQGHQTQLGRRARPKEEKMCGVCGDKALGYNFDAVSCESCKAFFRRYLPLPISIPRHVYTPSYTRLDPGIKRKLYYGP